MNSRDPVVDLDTSDERASFFHALAESSPDLIVCYDTSLRRTYINATAHKVCGDRLVLGRPLGEGGSLPPAVFAAYAAAVKAVLADGETRELDFSGYDA